MRDTYHRDFVIGLAEVERRAIRSHDPPLHVLRFHHVEFAFQRRRVGLFRQLIRTHGRSNENAKAISFLAQRLSRCRHDADPEDKNPSGGDKSVSGLHIFQHSTR